MQPARHLLIYLALCMLSGCTTSVIHRTSMVVAPRQIAAKYWVYVAGQGAAAPPGAMYVAKMDAATGEISTPMIALDGVPASFIAVHPGGAHLYTVANAPGPDGKPRGTVNAIALDPQTGQLTLLNQQDAAGLGACYISIDPSGRHAFVANYSGASASVLPIAADGRLGEPTAVAHHSWAGVNRKRHDVPHPHCIDLAPDGKKMLVCDLGMDKVMQYDFAAATGTLMPAEPPFASLPPGSGPRHLVFSPDGQFVYVVNELIPGVSVFTFDPRHGLSGPVQTISMLPSGVANPDFSGSAILMHPSGRFLYASTRGRDTITCFAVDPDSGRLTVQGEVSSQGRTPRHMAMDPAGNFLLAENQASDTVVEFRIDPHTGALMPTGTILSIKSPMCAVFVPVEQ